MVTTAVLTAILIVVAVLAVAAVLSHRGPLEPRLSSFEARALRADRPTGLQPQLTAGARGCRAPPAAFA
ncbi:hypothetical protein [Paractinoplanes hotanensis]|uniref:Uncharacterized protein n=1 Tax=Paractinoplanes hotanensis TaxID=2906497 RepID=A0ABT0XR90_9ACTN|nr:hypothetical protein [Actinoplanes hotanensis]MCM4076284.1 hypothetical protein [Actinoplanes hotanensis]